MKLLQYISSAIVILLLFGCNSGSDDSITISPPQQEKSLVSYSDITIQNKISSNTFAVNLNDYIYNPKKEEIYIDTIESSKNNCSFNYDPASSDLSFYVKTEKVGVCEYNFSLTTKDNKLPDKTIRFLTSSEDVQSLIRPVSLTLMHSENFSIDLTSEIHDVDWSDFSLTDAYSNDSGITFTSSGNTIQGSAQETTGVNRIFIQLTNKSNTKVKFGIISLSVSNTSNSIPTADDFLAASGTKLETLINITIEDKYIDDIDGDDLKLVDIYSYSGDVNLVPSIDNKTFSFYTKKPGVYDISYVVSDSKGGLAAAIARIETETKENFTWQTIIEKNKKFYPPLTVEELDAVGFLYQNSYSESHSLSSGLMLYNVSLLTYDSAKLFCSIRGMDLPSQDDISDLLGSSHSNFVSNDAPYDWPYKHDGKTRGYWLKNQKIGEYKTYNFETSSYYSTSPEDVNLAMCVQEGVLTSFIADDNPVYIRGGTGSTTLTAAIKTSNGLPLDGKGVYFYTDDPDTILSNNLQITDTSGESLTDIFSDIEKNVTVYANYLTDRLQINIQFLIDKISAIKLAVTDNVMKKGDSQEIDISVEFDSGTIEKNPNTMPTFNIVSSDSDVIGLELTPSTYIAHAKELGNSDIIAERDSIYSNKLSMTVINPAVSLKLLPKSLAFFDSETASLTSGVLERYDGSTTDILSAAGQSEVLWTTDKPGIIEYDPATNIITPIGTGSVILTATVVDTPTISDSIIVTIIPPLDSIAFEKGVMTTNKGETIKNTLKGIAKDGSQYDIPPDTCSATISSKNNKNDRGITSVPNGNTCTFSSDGKAGLHIVTGTFRSFKAQFGVNLNPLGTLREVSFKHNMQVGSVGTVHHNLMTATYSNGSVDEQITVIPEDCSPIYDEAIGTVRPDSFNGCLVKIDSSHNNTTISILGRYRGEIAGYKVKTGSGSVYFEDPVIYSEKASGVFNKIIVDNWDASIPALNPMNWPNCSALKDAAQIDFTEMYRKENGTGMVDGAAASFDNYDVQSACWTQLNSSAKTGSEILIKATDAPSGITRKAFYILRVVDNGTPLERAWFVDQNPTIPLPNGLGGYFYASKIKAKPKGPGMYRVLSPVGFYNINNNDTLNHATGSGCEAINLDESEERYQPIVGLGAHGRAAYYENIGSCNFGIKAGVEASGFKKYKYKITATLRGGIKTSTTINKNA